MGIETAIGVGASLLGSSMQADATSSAAAAQSASDAARLAEEKRVREQLQKDTEAQRLIADQAFADYQSGLLTYAQAQQKAAQAMQGVQNTIANSQLGDAAKATAMAEFKPYAISSGTGKSFFDTATGQAGYNLSPQLAGYQQDLYGKAGQAAQGIAVNPQDAAAQYMSQQQGLLQPGRQAEDIALRNQQLSRGRIGLGIASEAAGGGAGGMLNPEQFSMDRARAQADAQIAANATQAGQTQSANQLALTQGLFNTGYAPEAAGIDALKTGANIGQMGTQAGAAQAGLYAAGMGDYYRSLLGAAQTGQEGGLFTPAAQQAGATEAYQRQQQYLSNLQGNQLPYQPMTTPQATVPGSAYMNAALGSNLANMGMGMFANQMNNQFNTASTYNTNPLSQQSRMLAAQDSWF
jgi:hypothetical protein